MRNSYGSNGDPEERLEAELTITADISENTDWAGQNGLKR